MCFQFSHKPFKPLPSRKFLLARVIISYWQNFPNPQVGNNFAKIFKWKSGGAVSAHLRTEFGQYAGYEQAWEKL